MKNRLIRIGVLIVVLAPIVWMYIVAPRLEERARLTRIAELTPKLETEIAAGKWSDARDTRKLLQAHGFVVSPEKVAAIEAGIEKQAAIDMETRRRSTLAQGVLDAKGLLADPKQSADECTLARVWSKIVFCESVDPEWGEVNQLAPKLEAVRKKLFKAAVEAQMTKEVDGRQAYAKVYENRLLDSGISADVWTTGSAREALTVKWPLVSKALVHKISQGTVLEEMRLIGFRTVTYTDGFNESYSFTLQAASAEASVKDVWYKKCRSQLVTEPFVLTNK